MTRSNSQGKKRNRTVRANHRQKIAELRLTGNSIADIVRITRISKSTVHRELRSLAADWRAAAADSIDEHRQLELARLEVIEREAWIEWERSREDYSKEISERMKIPGKSEGDLGLETEPKVIKRETGDRIGDARFLQILLNAGGRRAKLLGLDAPTKVAPTDPTGKKSYQNMTCEEIEKRIAELQAKRERKSADAVVPGSGALPP